MTGVEASGGGGMTLSTLKLDRGYYRTSAESQVILKCHQEKACIGGVEPSQYCEKGYQGPCKANPLGVSHSDCMRISTVARVSAPKHTSAVSTPHRPRPSVALLVCWSQGSDKREGGGVLICCSSSLLDV